MHDQQRITVTEVENGFTVTVYVGTSDHKGTWVFSDPDDVAEKVRDLLTPPREEPGA